MLFLVVFRELGEPQSELVFEQGFDELLFFEFGVALDSDFLGILLY